MHNFRALLIGLAAAVVVAASGCSKNTDTESQTPYNKDLADGAAYGPLMPVEMPTPNMGILADQSQVVTTPAIPATPVATAPSVTPPVEPTDSGQPAIPGVEPTTPGVEPPATTEPSSSGGNLLEQLIPGGGTGGATDDGGSATDSSPLP